jgi:serine protease Do
VITKDVPILERYFDEAPGGGPFDDFFGNDFFSPFQFRTPQLRQRGTEKREIGGGSGFLVTADGMVITNRHVVSQTDVEYTVFTNDGTKYAAQVLARDPVNDIAVLDIDGQDLPFLEFGNSDNLQVGQTVIAIGNALSEFRNTVSVGVISGLSRSIRAGNGLGQSEQLEEVIQTDAAINPGNSGGPLLDLQGQVIGVNVAVALGSENIGFALPAGLVTSVVESVKESGTIVRPYLGVRYIPVTPALKERNLLSVDFGVLVTRGETPQDLAVIPGSPADKAGLKEGDIILEADGTRLDENTSLAAFVRKKQVGDVVTLKVLQQGQEKTVDVTLEAMPQ